MKVLPLITGACILSLSSGFSASSFQPSKEFYTQNPPVYSSVKPTLSSEGKKVYVKLKIENLMFINTAPQLSSNQFSSYKFEGYLPNNGDALVTLTIMTIYGNVVFQESLKNVATNSKVTLRTEDSNFQYSVDVVVVKDYLDILIPVTNKVERILTYQIRTVDNFQRASVLKNTAPTVIRMLPHPYMIPIFSK